MPIPDTLSTSQWSRLQALFERALEAGAEDRSSLLDRTIADDPVLGRSLAAMLAAHEQWQGRTDAAQGDWQEQAYASALLGNGESIGPYRIVGMLGEGGMGVVYRAERADGEVTLTVAIKVLRPGTLDAVARERFQRERDLLAGLNHPHIARLFDAGVSRQGQPYFVMEYVQGATLVKYCDAHQLDLRARLRLFLDVCDAVRHAHNQLVLHRDIKPGNVLVDEAGVAKLIDFGIAKPLALGEEQVAATATAHRYFSPMNVAPEQLRGERMGVACDVYQLGTLLYELLCGRPVFQLEGKTLSAIERAIVQEIPVPPSVRAKTADAAIAHARGCADVQALSRQLGGDLDEILLMALRKEPARRYASVEQLMDDIGRHLDLRPVRARGSHRAYRIGRYLRRSWGALSVAALALLAVIGFIVTLDLQSRQMQRERDRAVAEEQRAEGATKFLVGIFKAADPKVSLSRTTPIGEVLENGRRRMDTQLSAQPQLRADLSYALAEIYSDLASLQDAQKYASESLRLREALEAGSLAVAESRSQLAGIDARLDQCRQATSLGARAMDLFSSFHVGVAKTAGLQTLLIDCRARDQGGMYASEHLHALLDALEHDPAATPQQIVGLSTELSYYENVQGKPLEVIRLCQASIDLLARKGILLSGEGLNAQVCLADGLNQAGWPQLAAVKYAHVADGFRHLYGPDSPQYAMFLINRANTFFGLGKLREAEADLLEAHRIVGQTHGPTVYKSMAADSLASLYEDGFKDLAKAGPYHDEALRELTDTGPHDTGAQIMRTNQARWLARVGREHEAETALRALQAETTIDTQVGMMTRLTLATILVRTGRQEQAETLFAACKKEIDSDRDFDEFRNALAQARKGEY